MKSPKLHIFNGLIYNANFIKMAIRQVNKATGFILPSLAQSISSLKGFAFLNMIIK